MTSTQQRKGSGTSVRPDNRPYAIVVASDREGVDVVLHGLSADQAEQITTQKNQNLERGFSAHALPENQLSTAK
jgi:hypothetical protein